MQQAIQCDHCCEWQHRICEEYREAVWSREVLDWICGPCLLDINEDAKEDDKLVGY